jgi:serine/threonine-protein kinase RsbW
MSRQNDIVEEEMTIPGEKRYVREVSSKILEQLKIRGVNEDTLFDIRLCVEEVVRNAIQHGSLDGSNAKVRIRYGISGGVFTIEVEDQGAGFDHGNVPDPTREENIMKGGGRGVYLVRHLMDKVEYNDKGNRVKLTKRI